jgi:hypothetical protein
VVKNNMLRFGSLTPPHHLYNRLARCIVNNFVQILLMILKFLLGFVDCLAEDSS